MIGAYEKQKLVYVLNRDTAARLTISSPLEANMSHTLVASEAQKHSAFYELDLGLNHVYRKWSEQVDNSADLLVTVPGGGDGPSVLVCAENFVIYKNQGHPDVRAVIPRRADLTAERGVLIVSAAMHKLKSMFFFLLQTEYGDIFKGSLFAASDFGNHALYQFKAIGDDADVETSSASLMETEEGFQPVFFQPRRLKNLVRIDQVESVMPIMDMKVSHIFEEETPQIFPLCGRGPRSSLRILRTGLAISEMAVSKLPGDDSLMQVHPNGIQHIREDGRINEWRTPGKKTNVKVGFSRLQVVIALNKGELIYFEVDMTGQLMEVEKHEMSGDVARLDIAPLPEGGQRSRFLAVGSYDNTIRVLSLDPDDCMQILSVQSVSSAPESLLFLEVLASVGGEDCADHPASLFSMQGQACNALLVKSSMTRYIHQGHFLLTPLTYETPEYAASFSSDQCVEGVVAVAGEALRVFTIERLGETFNETIIPLRYTLRKFVLRPKKKLLVIIESDQGAFTAEEREAARKECFEAARTGGNGNLEQIENGVDDEDNDDPLSAENYGYPKAESDKWVSCIRVLDPRTANTTCQLALQENEAAFSVCTVNFHDKEHGTLLVLAVGVPVALCQFQGRLLAGIGRVLRLYDLGKRSLLKKCENKLFPNTICSIQTYLDRIYVGDIQESFHYCKYRRDENQLDIFADDCVPRWLTASYHIDFDTMAGADKFGNIYFMLLPQDVSDAIEEDPTGRRIKWEQGKLNGAPNKVEEIVQFHVDNVVTCLQKASLIPGGGECFIYGTVMGSVGALHAFTSRDDVDFFSHLEMHLRQEHTPLCGRDHMAFRSAYFPVKDVIDGDLCEHFPTLPMDLQRKIADELDRTPEEILKKLE
ncbi:splicing factor 3B subunit 3-like [Quillaja saponaria]|uniref:Splicing factor 3B subunit 3-like n=1 Tax=Quillaja saponaria TaxID=32244 RepID=A0AAD7PY38_QUISA|nr:splicing factor 3B subunit 3-like [Quillaja saponaria]KAJ7971329.1 splicing factor 3B subunit 3-like [Quillaja saponaria]